MERVHKGIAGYGKETEKRPATHVILTVEEYNKLLMNIRNAEYKTEQTIQKARSEVASYKKQADNLISQEKEEAQKRIEAIQSDFNKAGAEIHRLIDLNSNLLRISKERANSKRGLKPKKVHHGYMVIDSQQYTYIHNVKGNTTKLPCWKVRIQTPYDSSIPYNTITKEILNDLRTVFGSSLGISQIIDISTKSNEDFNKSWAGDRNLIFKTSYKANNKTGLWEVEYLVKSDIKIPEDMRTK